VSRMKCCFINLKWLPQHASAVQTPLLELQIAKKGTWSRMLYIVPSKVIVILRRLWWSVWVHEVTISLCLRSAYKVKVQCGGHMCELLYLSLKITKRRGWVGRTSASCLVATLHIPTALQIIYSPGPFPRTFFEFIVHERSCHSSL
jgi:hypothetical protein